MKPRNHKWMAFVAMLFCVAFAVTDVAAKKPTCPGHPSCGDTTDGPVQLGPDDDVWPVDTNAENDGDDIVYGGDGNDHIYGGLGNDDLGGEAGNDTLDGGDGDDGLNGGDGADNLYGGNGNDRMYVNGDGSESCEPPDSCDFADGGDGRDSLYLSFLDDVLVVFEDSTDDSSRGSYSGSYYVKKVGTIFIEGEFKNIEYISGSALDGEYHGNELANRIAGHEGNDIIYGYGGDDELFGGGLLLSHTTHIGDYINGGEGNDRIYGYHGDDYIVGGSGSDKLFFRQNGDHDIVEDFEADDKIVIYNSNICWPDLTITTIDFYNDGIEDTKIAWKVKKASMSITLLNFSKDMLSASDFDFEQDSIPLYSGCP